MKKLQAGAKHQASTFKLQRNIKLQVSETLREILQLEVWSFSGSWSLKFGAFISSL
jgi:hypothetical protein